jgi:hypothetical protein
MTAALQQLAIIDAFNADLQGLQTCICGYACCVVFACWQCIQTADHIMLTAPLLPCFHWSVLVAGVSVGTVFFLLLLTVAVTAGGMYAVYKVHLRKSMHADMRNILEEYVPLDSAPSAAGPFGSTVARKFSSMIPESFTDVVTPRISTAMSTALSAGTPRAMSSSIPLNAGLSERSDSAES